MLKYKTFEFQKTLGLCGAFNIFCLWADSTYVLSFAYQQNITYHIPVTPDSYLSHRTAIIQQSESVVKISLTSCIATTQKNALFLRRCFFLSHEFTITYVCMSSNSREWVQFSVKVWIDQYRLYLKHSKSLWIKASAKCIHFNVLFKYKLYLWFSPKFSFNNAPTWKFWPILLSR